MPKPLWVGLHTSDPAVRRGTEALYRGYCRVPIAGLPATDVRFPACEGGKMTITHFSIGSEPKGLDQVRWSGMVTPPMKLSVGVSPRLTLIVVDEDEET